MKLLKFTKKELKKDKPLDVYEEPDTYKSPWSYWLGSAQSLLIAVLIVLVIRIFVAQPFIVSGDSMDNTFADDQYLIIDKISYHFNQPERGDVVVFRYPNNPKRYHIKRIIGLPGESVIIDHNKVMIKNNTNPDGFELNESYILTPKNSVEANQTLNQGEYFVMGDNRDRSLDSRVWGALPVENITGRVFLRLLPVDKIDFWPGDLIEEYY